MGVAEFSGSAARALVRSLVRFYYPRIAVDGAERIPRHGPVLLAANHPNSLIDPILLGIAARRPVRLLAKAPLFDLPLFGRVLRELGMIPAYRGQDGVREVARNLESLQHAAAALAAGDVVGIFPEGKSHDELQVAMVRSGAARLAMQAVSAGAGSLVIVPVGLNYERKEGFRTAVWINVGEPIAAADWLATHGGDAHAAMRALTPEINRRLQAAVIHLADTTWEPLLAEVEGLLPPLRRRSPLHALRLRKTVADAINDQHVSAADAAQALTAEVRAFGERRAAAGLPPRARFFRDPWWRRAAALARDAFGLTLATVVATTGLLHHLVPHGVTRLVAGRLGAAGRMTVALYRLLVGFPIYLLWYGLVGWSLLQVFQPWVAVTWLAVMPFAGLVAVHAVRRWRVLMPVWWAEVRLLFRRPRANELRAEHARLAAALGELARLYPFAPDTGAVRAARVLRPPLWLNLLVGGATLSLAVASGAWLLRDRPVEFWRTDAPALHAQDPAHLQAALASEERALLAVLDGLAELEARHARFEADLRTGTRSYYRPDDEDEIRRMLATFLAHRSALLRTAWQYQRYEQLADEPLRLRAQLLHYTAAAVAYDYSARFVAAFADKELSRRKLNEPEPRWDLPAGTYDRIRANLGNIGHRRWLEAGWQRYHALLSHWGAHRLGPKDAPVYSRFHDAIATAGANTARLHEQLFSHKLATAVTEVKTTAGAGYYQASAAISTLIGDARLRVPREGRALVTPDLLARVQPLLRPGDILIERRNWYLSNAFLPGYWPHAALYVGTAEELRELGWDDDPRVAAKLAEFAGHDAAGHRYAVIEAISEGVVFTSLEHSAGEADAVAVLRPRLPPEAVKEAIARAFSHAGKPYDFEFDFFSSDRLVCTEVVHRAYAGRLDFPLVEILGRRTLPALEIVRCWADGSDAAPLEFVALLDGDELAGTCRWADAATLRASLERPALLWLN